MVARDAVRMLAASLLLALGAWAQAPAAPAAPAALAVRQEVRDGAPLITLENPFLSLTFEPARGGRCTRFVFRDNGEQIVGRDPVSGMFIDHWAKYSWPSGLLWLPYQHEIVGDGTARSGIRLWVTVPSQGGGKGDPNPQASLALPTSPDLVGLVVQKTIWLNAADDAILVEQEIRNPTAESRAVAPYIQHNLSLGGSRYHDSWYLPSSSGVRVNLQPDDEGGRTIGPDWVLDPTAGWIAVRDRQTARALLFAFDYNTVRRLYTCGSTAEWFMDAVPIGPGRSVAFQYLIKPVRGLQDFAYGSQRLVADIRPAEGGGGQVRVSHDLAATGRPLEHVQVEIMVSDWHSAQVIAQKAFTVDYLGFEKSTQEIEFLPPHLLDGVLIKVTVQADGGEERYELFYAGDQAAHERRTGFFATPGGALAGATGDAYFLKPPRQVKMIEKPNFAMLARPAAERFRCLVVFGLYTHILRLDDALAEWRHRGRIAPEFTWANCPPNGIETFPGTYDELFGYDLVVLADVNCKALGDIAVEMLCDYVEQGGALLVTGGPYALGNGEFEETRFLEVLPVSLSGPFDLKWAGKGASWELLPAAAAADLPLLAGVELASSPRAFWRHVVRPRAGAQVVLTAGEAPALVLGAHGKGRVAVLTLSPTGVGEPTETAWWDWPGWFALLRNTVTWLSHEEGRQP